jgi:hypothetical protein
MATSNYANNVFLNCPFDEEYVELRNAIVFSIFDCGFIARCALEEDDSGVVRFDKINKILSECKFGIHDVSRTELDVDTGLPRFNMPLELGVFLGAKKFGGKNQKRKKTLIIDKELYRYQKYISDIAGQDIRAHYNKPDKVITIVRNWLNSATGRKTIPGGRKILNRYYQFVAELPDMCNTIPIDMDELTFNDYTNFIYDWLSNNS